MSREIVKSLKILRYCLMISLISLITPPIEAYRGEPSKSLSDSLEINEAKPIRMSGDMNLEIMPTPGQILLQRKDGTVITQIQGAGIPTPINYLTNSSVVRSIKDADFGPGRPTSCKGQLDSDQEVGWYLDPKTGDVWAASHDCRDVNTYSWTTE